MSRLGIARTALLRANGRQHCSWQTNKGLHPRKLTPWTTGLIRSDFVRATIAPLDDGASFASAPSPGELTEEVFTCP
jgi:hypothetical protein